MARRKRTESGFMTNRRMNDDTYALRRKVMAHVYVAKAMLANEGYALPRIDVRIGDRHEADTLACARMGDNIIWVDAETVGKPYLRQVVWHEVCHAVRAIEHVDGCPLMGAYLTPLKDADADKLFIQYMTE